MFKPKDRLSFCSRLSIRIFCLLYLKNHRQKRETKSKKTKKLQKNLSRSSTSYTFESSFTGWRDKMQLQPLLLQKSWGKVKILHWILQRLTICFPSKGKSIWDDGLNENFGLWSTFSCTSPQHFCLILMFIKVWLSGILMFLGGSVVYVDWLDAIPKICNVWDI